MLQCKVQQIFLLYIHLNNLNVVSCLNFSEAASAIWLPECIDEESLWHTHALFANQPVSSSSQARLCCPTAVCRQGNYGFSLLAWPISMLHQVQLEDSWVLWKSSELYCINAPSWQRSSDLLLIKSDRFIWKISSVLENERFIKEVKLVK